MKCGICETELDNCDTIIVKGKVICDDCVTIIYTIESEKVS